MENLSAKASQERKEMEERHSLVQKKVGSVNWFHRKWRKGNNSRVDIILLIESETT